MKNLKSRPLLVLFVIIFISSNMNAQIEMSKKLEDIAVIDEKIMVPMTDGIRLCTNVYRPKTDKPVPIIFSRTPYNFNSWGDGEERKWTKQRAYEAVKRGYAYVVQNERGRYFSEGKWDILGLPKSDAYDAFTWMADQPWSNGKIGTLGCSSTAEWQMAIAALDHPAHAAMVPQGYGAGVGKVGRFHEQGNWYRGGATQMLFISWLYSVQNDEFRPRVPKGATQEDLNRISRFYDLASEAPKVDWAEMFDHLPVSDLIKNVNGTKGIYDKMVKRKPEDKAWYEGGLYHEEMDFGVPSFWFVSWFDVSSGPNIELFNHIRNDAKYKAVSDDQYLIIAPTLHCRFTRATEHTMVGDLDVGDARLNYDEQIYNWFDYQLKGEKNNFKSETPHVQYYTMGSNKWQSSDVWPPANTKMTTFHLSSQGRANSLYGDGKLKMGKADANDMADEFVYNPLNPVPSYGGNVCCTGNAIDGGSFDQQAMETRHDILVYSTEPLKEGVEVSGFIETTLYVSSDAKDTDFTIKLIDVHPDGSAYNLDETIQRELSPMSTSNYFKKGHQIRVEISSSNFPRFDRNLNTGGPNYNEKDAVIARNKVHHSVKYPSQLRLPIAQ